MLYVMGLAREDDTVLQVKCSAIFFRAVPIRGSNERPPTIKNRATGNACLPSPQLAEILKAFRCIQRHTTAIQSPSINAQLMTNRKPSLSPHLRDMIPSVTRSDLR